MDLYEISVKSSLPIRTLKRLQKLGCLKVGQSSNPLAAQIRFGLSRHNPLSVAHLIALLEDEDEILLDALGNHIVAAADQIAKLGDWRNDIAPPEIAMTIDSAAIKDEIATRNLIAWIQATLPAQGEVSHAWLAVRIAMGAKPHFRGIILNRINLALLNCRAQPEFAGWFTVRKAKGQAVTFYHRPADLVLDL